MKSKPTSVYAIPTIAVGAAALGTVALGAFALGACAIGAVAIGGLAVGRARIRRLEIDELVVRRLRVAEQLTLPPEAATDSELEKLQNQRQAEQCGEVTSPPLRASP